MTTLLSAQLNLYYYQAQLNVARRNWAHGLCEEWQVRVRERELCEALDRLWGAQHLAEVTP